MEELINKIIALQAENQAFSRCMDRYYELYNVGKDLEENKNYEDAISAYIEAKDFALSSAYFSRIQNCATSFDRLAVLYRKLKMYEEEVALLRLYVDLCHRDNAYFVSKVEKRLEKATMLLKKKSV